MPCSTKSNLLAKDVDEEGSLMLGRGVDDDAVGAVIVDALQRLQTVVTPEDAVTLVVVDGQTARLAQA